MKHKMMQHIGLLRNIQKGANGIEHAFFLVYVQIASSIHSAPSHRLTIPDSPVKWFHYKDKLKGII